MAVCLTAANYRSIPPQIKSSLYLQIAMNLTDATEATSRAPSAGSARTSRRACSRAARNASINRPTRKASTSVRLRTLRVEQATLHSRALHRPASLDLRLLKWTSVDLQAGVIRLVMRKTKRPVLLPIVLRVRAVLDECRKRTVMSEYVLVTPEGQADQHAAGSPPAPAAPPQRRAAKKHNK